MAQASAGDVSRNSEWHYNRVSRVRPTDNANDIPGILLWVYNHV